ncbi:hypothetical protein QQS45_08405 [Alteriqipengyuania flavescens]|uniref:hypothetical protein n=1 Tax=Alteriqipengyuania flavescens TaxID=3053610 RepID=UPI0025B55198|nr:hypothetical protein [Alteriqipengyuania flavescens]WJY17668.1 hypothetical protein QQW98_08400 [Alteriqipengyuania flavescens]WJY23611.1 hypothetical protein QQS45_08405 [Alteriqipengyuania flavescens]
MCAVKTPKISTPEAQKPPKPVVIRNEYLDNRGETALARNGRSALRIDLKDPARKVGMVPPTSPLRSRAGITAAPR